MSSVSKCLKSQTTCDAHAVSSNLLKLGPNEPQHSLNIVNTVGIPFRGMVPFPLLHIWREADTNIFLVKSLGLSHGIDSLKK